jgi:5-methylthioadenosine/S-adenosylhomocysteine deaminase
MSDATLLAGEIDEDSGPTYVLRGRVATMAAPGEVRDDAQVVISKGRIAAVVHAGSALPAEFSGAPAFDTKGTIYPGLIDLHNHFAYNIRPLWPLPKLYKNRSQWGTPRYSAEVSKPVKAIANSFRTARSLVRYVEAKALIGGTTTGQGIKTQIRGGFKLYNGIMRNVEQTRDPRLPEATTHVPDLKLLKGGDESEYESFRRTLSERVCFYHLAEGIDDVSREHFTDLTSRDLINANLVGVHALGLSGDDLKVLAAKGAKVVWSPFSNQLLYGETLDLKELRDSDVAFSIGCDWAPTGSKNLLQELKVAQHAVEQQDADFTSEDLVRAVTATAASLMGWEDQLGRVAENALADLLVLGFDDGDPWDRLVAATEADVDLVVVHGIPRYGAKGLMSRLRQPGDPAPEPVRIAGAAKAFNLRAPSSPVSDVSYATAVQRLEDGMADLPARVEEGKDKDAALLAGDDSVDTFSVELDNEYEPSELDELDPTLLGSVPMLTAVPLDPPEVGADGYWELIDAQPNIDDALKQALKQAYGA